MGYGKWSPMFLLGLCLPTLEPKQVQTSAAPTEKWVAAVGTASNVRELGRRINTLFKGADPKRIRSLKHEQQTQIALRAAWEEALFSSLRNNRHSKRNRLELDPLAASRFLGFVEGRIGITPPSWWEESVKKSCSATLDDPVRPGVPNNAPYHCVSIRGFKLEMPAEMTLRPARDGAVLSVGDKETFLPVGIERACVENPGRSLSGALAKDRCILALHTPMAGSYPLFCLDRPSGKKVWETEVWDAGNTGGTGPWREHVAVRVTDKQVFVIGSGSFCFYIEAFDLNTGKNLFRFASKYWFEDK